MSERCGVCLTVHAPEDGHARPSRASLLVACAIGAPFVGFFAILCAAFSLTLAFMGTGVLGAFFALVVMFVGAMAIPVLMFYGLAAFTSDDSLPGRAGRLLWSIAAYGVALVGCLTPLPWWCGLLALPAMALAGFR